MEKRILEIAEKAKFGDEGALVEIIDKFRPIIKKYSRKLKYETAETDLVIELIKIVRNMPINSMNLNEEREIISYIAASIKYQYYRLYRQNALSSYQLPLNDYILFNCQQVDIDSKIFINQLVDKLSTKEKFIINSIFFYGYKEAELAKMLKITRQAINKIKNSALRKLLKYIDNE